MRVYCVSYDLAGEDRDDSALIAVLQSMGRWWRFLESTWLIGTESTAQAIWDQVRPAIKSEDRVLIIEVTNQKSGWLPKEAWDWINLNVSKV